AADLPTARQPIDDHTARTTFRSSNSRIRGGSARKERSPNRRESVSRGVASVQEIQGNTPKLSDFTFLLLKSDVVVIAAARVVVVDDESVAASWKSKLMSLLSRSL